MIQSDGSKSSGFNAREKILGQGSVCNSGHSLSKHRSLQQYIRPLNTMIDQIDRLLKDYTGMQEKNLQAIKKKLEYMVSNSHDTH
jgi:hypothetical protein